MSSLFLIYTSLGLKDQLRELAEKAESLKRMVKILLFSCNFI